MKYDEKEFDSAVKKYGVDMGQIKGKSVLVVIDIGDESAFYSVAPLSRAIHNQGGDMHVIAEERSSVSFAVLNDVWKVYNDLEKGIENKKTTALKEFMFAIERKGGGEFARIFKSPEIIIKGSKNGFEGDRKMPYRPGWHVKYRQDEVEDAARAIWEKCYRLKEGERVGFGFEVIPTEENLDLPLEDYLDSYTITRLMMLTARISGSMRAASATPRLMMNEKGERVSELKNTLIGCELSKDIDENIFKKYLVVSDLLNINRLKHNEVVFSIKGKGYYGKHLFGEVIGYPSPCRRTRWQSPSQIIFKFDWYPQSRIDTREPLGRLGFTETLPLDIFIKTCNIDWAKLREKNKKVQEISNKCELIRVRGDEIKGLRTDFTVYLKKKGNGRRRARRDDGYVARIHDEILREEGITAGLMANIPSGEVFVTPENFDGRFVGDVVISIDQSYRLSKKKPLVIDVKDCRYKVVSGPKDILDKIKKKKGEAWEKIEEQEKHKSLPAEIIKTKKECFDFIGEFAVNTNPNAEFCNYLIVNEKIANMIHVALGSGFDPDRATEYHWDIVIDCPRQKLDVWGEDSLGNRHYLLKGGKFIV